MLTKAVARFIRVSPSKTRRVADLIRGKTVEQALAILQYSPQMAARLVEKVLRSAIANAEHNHQVRTFEDLRVGAIVDVGPSLKRIQPRAMGRAFHIRHRTSHITITLDQAANGQPARRDAPPARRGERRAAPASRPARRAAGAAKPAARAAKPPKSARS
jgi:large subunit ribosomal protein L22